MMNRLFGSTPSIAKNLSVSLVLVLVTVIVAAIFTHGSIMSITDKKELNKKADEMLINLQRSIELPIWNFDSEALNKIVEAYFLSNQVTEIVIKEGLSDTVIIQRKDPDGYGVVSRQGPVVHGDDVIAQIKIGLTTKLYEQKLNRLITSYIAIGVALIIMFALVTGLLLRVFLKNPLEKLIHGLERLSEGDYSHKLTQVPQEEFSVIVKAFETMTDQIREREKSLSKAKTYISDLFNAMDSILVGVDAEGRVTHGNTRAGEFIEQPVASMLGKKFEELFPLFKVQAQMIPEAIESQTLSRDLKVQVPHANGIKYYSIAISPLTSEGELGAVIRINDVTERIFLEEMMIQTEKMLSVGGLAAGMAHEINNPLAGMLQNAQVMENRLLNLEMPANLNAAKATGLQMEQVKNFMEIRGIFDLLAALRQAGGRAARIVENMLSFSRKSDTGFEFCDLRSIVDNTLELAASDYDLKKNYDFKSIEILKSYSDNLSEIPCDVTKIQQVVLNILKNGAQAMVENFTLGKPSTFNIRIYQTSDAGVIEIHDNGPGMDEKTRKRIFEPFFTTKPVGIGTGLGLSVSYFIITENHKGTLAVKSAPGRGSVFIISLPKQHLYQEP